MRYNLSKIFWIMIYDFKIYFLKPPNLIMGFMIPIVMILTFTMRDFQNIKAFIPGLMAMTVFFGTSSMETTTIIFARKDKTLERLLMAPVSFGVFIISKILGGAVFGLLLTIVIFPVAIIYFSVPIYNISLLIVTLVLSAITFAAFGALLAVFTKESHNITGLANLFRFPMVFLSGVFIPVTQMPDYLQKIAYVLPLTYSVDLMRQALFGISGITPWLIGLLLLMLFGMFFLIASAKCFFRWIN